MKDNNQDLNETKIDDVEFSRHTIIFRQRLLELRQEKGYTQKELADLIGISVWTLNSYESRGVLPRFDIIIIDYSRFFEPVFCLK